jgi:hypothetical protein
MIDNNKFIFCTGAPGSAWSSISHRMKKSINAFDCTDEDTSKSYHLPKEHMKNYRIKDRNWEAKTHMGSYFGPNHEFGHHFDEIPKYYDNNIQKFYTECLGPFKGSKPNKLIRSHWFAYWLDWIWDNCKGHDMLLIWREPYAAKDWWYSMGGWQIEYPIYWWYENDQKMWEKIQEESNKIWEFGERKGVQWLDYDENERWLDVVGRDRLLKIYAQPKLNDTIKIGYLSIT